MLTWLRESPLSTATWVDWIDIALLAWVTYRALQVIRGTRGMQSLLGLGLLGLVYLVSDLAGLTTLRWILDNLFVYVVLALLILFQDDIRLALARAGGTVFAPNTRRSDANVREEVIKATFALAHRKVGALVALERVATLEPFVEGAHALDAEVSSELLAAIFHPSSPIHDGAVIIRGQRLVAAGVFLPLTLSKDVSRTYGTRHRAAIGLTEKTDAICLVASEERGTVALVEGGQVVPVADPNDLRVRLQQGLEHARPLVRPRSEGA